MAVTIKGNRITRKVDEVATLKGIIARWTKGVIAALADETADVVVGDDADAISFQSPKGGNNWNVNISIKSMLKAAKDRDRQEFIRQTIVAQMRILSAAAKIGYSSGRVVTSVNGIMPGGGGVPKEVPYGFHQKIHSGLETGMAIRRFVEKYAGYTPIMRAYATLVDQASKEKQAGAKNADPELVMAYMALTGQAPPGREKMYSRWLPHVDRRAKAKSIKTKVGVDIAFDVALLSVEEDYFHTGKQTQAQTNAALTPVVTGDQTAEEQAETTNALLDDLAKQFDVLAKEKSFTGKEEKIAKAVPQAVFTPKSRPAGVDEPDWDIYNNEKDDSSQGAMDGMCAGAADNSDLQSLAGAGTGLFEEFMDSVAGDQPQPLEPHEEWVADEIATYLRSIALDRNRIQFRPNRRSGSLDTKRLVNVVTGDSVLRRKVNKPTVSIDVGIAVDYSGSMNGSNAKDATSVARTLRAAIQRAGQGCYTAFFSSNVMMADEVPLDGQLMEIFSRFNGGTDTVPSILALGREVVAGKNLLKVLFVVTDGQPGNGMDEQKKALAELERQGVHVVEVLIGGMAPGGTAYAHEAHGIKLVSWLPNIVVDIMEVKMRTAGAT